MKKILMIFTVASTFAFTSCGSGTSNSDSETERTSEESTEEESTQEEINNEESTQEESTENIANEDFHELLEKKMKDQVTDEVVNQVLELDLELEDLGESDTTIVKKIIEGYVLGELQLLELEKGLINIEKDLNNSEIYKRLTKKQREEGIQESRESIESDIARLKQSNEGFLSDPMMGKIIQKFNELRAKSPKSK